jgi:hypothetical protein
VAEAGSCQILIRVSFFRTPFSTPCNRQALRLAKKYANIIF